MTAAIHAPRTVGAGDRPAVIELAVHRDQAARAAPAGHRHREDEPARPEMDGAADHGGTTRHVDPTTAMMSGRRTIADRRVTVGGPERIGLVNLASRVASGEGRPGAPKTGAMGVPARPDAPKTPATGALAHPAGPRAKAVTTGLGHPAATTSPAVTTGPAHPAARTTSHVPTGHPGAAATSLVATTGLGHPAGPRAKAATTGPAPPAAGTTVRNAEAAPRHEGINAVG
jgi:hypothetical protein